MNTLGSILLMALATATANGYAETQERPKVAPPIVVGASNATSGAQLPAVARDRSASAPASNLPSGISFRSVVRRVAPSVVTVVAARVTEHSLALDTKPISVGIGSGVVVDVDGFVVTNAHVVDQGTDFVVVLSDGSTRPAQLVGADLDADVAVLKVDGGGLQAIAMADIDDVAVGDIVLAVGNPLGVGQTVTQGIVSGIRGVAVRDRVLENVIQTDAAINPGNSGGALVDTSGRLVGINCVILSMSGGSEGIGFAIPVDVVQKVGENLRKSGRLRHAWLGLLMGRDSGGKGAPIVAVEQGAPSERAGFKAGDVVVSIQDRTITGHDDVSDILQEIAPGTAVNVCVQRAGTRSCADVVLAARPTTRGAIRLLGPASMPID